MSDLKCDDPKIKEEEGDNSTSGWLSRTLLAYPLSAEYIWSWFVARVGPISSYFQRVASTEDDPSLLAEERFLRTLRHKYHRFFVETKNGCKIWTLSSVPFPTSTNTETKSEGRPGPVVFIHGLMAGLAYWTMNLDCVVDAGRDVYAIDLPGFARSSRVEFEEDADSTEQSYIEYLDEWRQVLGLHNMTIVGHSFGGYITTAYSLSYPNYVSNIILVDPWGFPDVKQDMTAVVEQGDRSVFSSPLISLPVWFRILVIFMMPFSPFSFIRFAGRNIGPRLIHLLRPDMSKRYEFLFGSDDCLTVPNYVFYTNRLNPTGERAFRNLAMPLAWAKKPLIKRISRLHSKIIINFLYGARSWIDFQTGYEVKDILKDSSVNVHIIEGAGHHVFADQPELFNSLLCQILNGVTDSSSQVHRCLSDLSLCSIKDMPIM